MQHRTLAVGVLFLAASAFFSPAPAADEADTAQSQQMVAITAQLQQILDDYQAQNAAKEGFSRIALQVSLGDDEPISDVGPVIAVASGNDGLPDKQPMTTDTLFQVGSNNKSYTVALILRLEAAGKLNIDQTVGDWLPQYPAWKSVKIRTLLNMTSHIPTYDETKDINEKQLDLQYQFTFEQLIAAVNPDQGSKVPPTTGWSYSNTNYILAALIIEKASGMSYKKALDKWILKPLHLHDTYYFDGATPRHIVRRMSAGFYTDTSNSNLLSLVGQDMRAENLSWCGPAGAIIATLGNLAQWWRDVLALKVFPQAQLDEMEMLVSSSPKNQIPSGLPIPGNTNAANPTGFGLGLAQIYSASRLGGYIWYYQRMTYGYRVIFGYWPQYNLMITTAVNSAIEDEAVFFTGIFPATFAALLNAGIIHERGAATASQ